MRTLLLVITFIFTMNITAQTSYEKGMNKAFALWDQQKNTEASQLFERISADETVLTTKLTRAKEFLDAASAISENNPEIMISYALLNTAYIAFDGAKYGMTLSGENAAIYQKALSIAPNNPRVVLSKTEWAQLGSLANQQFHFVKILNVPSHYLKQKNKPYLTTHILV